VEEESVRKIAIKPWLLVAPLALLLAVAAACGSDGEGDGNGGAPDGAVVGQRVDVEGGSFTDITPRELQTMLADKDFPLVNVHIPYDGEIEGTDLFLPFDEISDHLGELPSQRDSKIVLYCRSGSMSATAATTLVGLGYTNVWNLDGGMIAWEDGGYPLLRDGE
jgi:rhodanese-related sulfurtransferase